MNLLASCLLVVFSLIPVGLVHASTAGQQPCQPESFIRHSHPQGYADSFMRAVERDSLMVLGWRLDSANLRPVRVEYIHYLDGSPPQVQVYAILRLPMELEAMPGCHIDAVTAVMTPGGSIEEVKAHVETF